MTLSRSWLVEIFGPLERTESVTVGRCGRGKETYNAETQT
jgi:hypothetical protein